MIFYLSVIAGIIVILITLYFALVAMGKCVAAYEDDEDDELITFTRKK